MNNSIVFAGIMLLSAIGITAVAANKEIKTMSSSQVQLNVVPINAAEGVFEPFWDSALSGLKYWEITLAPDAQAKVEQNWCWVSFEWQQRPASGAAFRMFRQVQVDCADYDRMLLSVMAPEHATVTIEATTDRGIRRIASAPAGKQKQELALELEGARKITAITLTITPGADGPSGGWLNWIGLQSTTRLEWVLKQQQYHSPAWEKFLKPETFKPTFKPAYGLVLNEKELEQLRGVHQATANAGNPSPFVAAAEAAAAVPPEKKIGDYVNFWDDTRYNRVRDHDKYLLTHGVNAAIAGQLLRDPAMLRLAARYAMSIAMCKHWDDGFICDFPGSGFDHRAFVQSICAYEVAAILDLAGEYFTDAGREFLLRRLAQEGLGAINYNTWRYDYIFNCNQLVWFAPGRMLALAVLQQHWQHIVPQRQIAYNDMVENLNRTISPDGSYQEGPTYFRCVGRDAGLGLYFYSRAAGVSLASVTPESMKRCAVFGEVLGSTDERKDVIPISDAIPYHEVISQAIMAQILPESAWARMLRTTFSHSHGWPVAVDKQNPRMVNLLDGAIAWQLALNLPKHDSKPVAVASLPDMGLMASQREFGGFPVKLLLIGGKQGTSQHLHEHQGSFVLEFAGDTFACDPGTCDYSNPLSMLVSKSDRHNLLLAEGVGQRPAPKLPLPADVLPQGHGDRQQFHAQMNPGPVCPDSFRTWTRSWDSTSPETLTITDDYELVAGTGVKFLWQTMLPMTVNGQTITIKGKHGQAEIMVPESCRITVEDLPLMSGVQHRATIQKQGTAGQLKLSVKLKITD